MKTIEYREKLLEQLKDEEFASAYLNEVLALNDHKALLVALKDVVDARGGIGSLAKKVKLQRQSIYKILSREGNPTLESFGVLLQQLGFRLSISPA